MSELAAKPMDELQTVARSMSIARCHTLRKRELVWEIMKARAQREGFAFVEGTLEILPEGFGFLRPLGYLPSPEDIYISPSQIRRFDLRTGDYVSGTARLPRDGERNYALLRVESVNNEVPDACCQRVPFDNLTPVYPQRRLKMEVGQQPISARLLDLVAPIGCGQRGLIVSPPKAGKTLLLKQMAASIAANHPEVYLLVLLIDERPEEVTDMQRSVRGEVVASTFDEPPEQHIRVAELVLERAKRLVEQKKDVVILLDSITRLARAYNLVLPPSGRTLSGGMDPTAFHKPKRFFGAARSLEEGGSLTVIATALVDTGSRLDDVVYEEFKGTGNMELHLDRRLAERRIFPAIDVKRSSTRKEEVLLAPDELEVMWQLRRVLANLGNAEATEWLIGRMQKTRHNGQFLQMVAKDLHN